MADNATGKKRNVRTPAQIAQADLDAAKERVTAAAKRVERAEQEVTAAKAAHEQAVRRADYAAKHPDLPAQPDSEQQTIPEPPSI